MSDSKTMNGLGEMHQSATETPAAGTLKGLYDSLRNRAKEGAEELSEKAKGAASTAEGKADEALSRVGETLRTVARNVREQTPSAGTVKTGVDAIAGGLEHGGQYLEERKLREIASDSTELIRKRPLTALALGVGVGYLLGRVLTRR